MAKGNRGGKRSAGNTKYNGFSITDKDGNTENYIVVNGVVQSAVNSKYSNSFLQDNSFIQNAYDTLGSVEAVIARVNKVGIGKASVLSDKQVDKMNADYKKQRVKNDKNYSPRNSKRGTNRHRNFWSAM